MHLPRHFYVIVVSATCLSPAVYGDFLGPSFPAPVDLASNQSLVAASWKNITSTLEAILERDASTNLPGTTTTAADIQNITFSLSVFSLHHPAVASSLQFHHTSSETAQAVNGTRKVDANSIYRIASVTKVFTVLTGLLKLSSTDWDRPLSEVLPPLGDYIRHQSQVTNTTLSVETTQWDKITLRALAAQIGGVPRDGFPNPGELLLAGASEEELMAVSGLPPYNASDPLGSPPCLSYVVSGESCPATPYLEGVANRPPAFPPWTTPAYSNNGFTLLGLAIANLTGKSMGQLYQELIFDPVNMTSSSSSAPAPSDWHRSVVLPSFAAENGIFVSSGGLFSTTTDLARFGAAVLNSTLLPPAHTRRWLKPVAHTARLRYSVGAPWEIVRYLHASSGVVTDMYTKLGDSGSYSAYLVLLPDYDAGFVALAAGTTARRGEALAAVADVVADGLLPGLQAQAAQEARRNFAGVYRADTSLNSSLSLSADSSLTAPPGLVITSWMSNGTDVLPWLAKVSGPGPFRLVPSVSVDNRAATSEMGRRQMAFRLVNSMDAPAREGTRSGHFAGLKGVLEADWVSVDALTYTGVGVPLFVFEVGSDGRAEVVSPAAYRVMLSRAV